MNVKERIFVLKVLEKMENHKEYSEKLGIKDASKYQLNKMRKGRSNYDKY